MPNWLSWWGEKDEQETVNVAELLEQVERQRAIIIEQASQIEEFKKVTDEWQQKFDLLGHHNEAFSAWVNAAPKFGTKEVTE
jgi:hypothetical protein